MKKPEYHRFGSPISPDGAIYLSRSKEGTLQAFTDIDINMLKLMGVHITPQLSKMIEEYNRQRQDETEREIDAEGIPDQFIKLFEIKRKAAVIKYCNKLELSDEELFLLCHNSSQIGYKRSSKYPEYIPEHLQLNKSHIHTLIKNDPQKFSKLVHQAFSERRRICVHLFENNDQWHCFYFSYQDMGSREQPHWRYGDHIHYVSYLWPNHTKDEIWGSFDVRKTNISDSIHIKMSITDRDAET